MIPDGWTHRRPFKIPKTCRHCNGPLKIVNGANPKAEHRVAACVVCDDVERWPPRGK